MTIADGMHQIVDNINGARMARVSDIAELKSEVGAIRADAAHMVHGFADERKSRGIELSRMLKSYNDGIIDDVQHLMGMFQKERIPFQEDLAEAHAIWQSQGSGGHVHTNTKAPKRTAPKEAEVTKTPKRKKTPRSNKKSSK